MSRVFDRFGSAELNLCYCDIEMNNKIFNVLKSKFINTVEMLAVFSTMSVLYPLKSQISLIYM